jgi:hypothetical protein
MWTTLVCELNLISVSRRSTKNHKGVSYHSHITIRNAYSDDVNKLQMKVLEQILHIEGRSAIYIILCAKKRLSIYVPSLQRSSLCPFSAPHLHKTRASPRKRKNLLIA